MKKGPPTVCIKTATFALIPVMVMVLLIEFAGHVATSLGILPYIGWLTPSCYLQPLACISSDANGAPIYVNGYRFYRQKGVPVKPVMYDAAGYRSSDSNRFESNSYRIAFFGDSYTEGLQVSDDMTFPSLVEKSLRDRGTNVMCFNFGVGGTGTYHQYLRYLTTRLDVRSDHVFLCFLPQNDVMNNHYKLGKTYELATASYLVPDDNGFLVFKPANVKHHNRSAKALNQAWNQYSFTATLCRLGLQSLAGRTFLLLNPLKAADHGDTWTIHRKQWLNVFGGPPNETWEEAWRITEGSHLTPCRSSSSGWK